MALSTLLFYACATLAVFCSVRVVTARHIFHAALYLACTLALLAVVYLLMQAEFVAVVQVLVYVGAVIVLIIFAVMLTAQIGDAKVEQTNRLALPAALGAAAAFLALSRALQTAPWDKAAAAAAQQGPAPVSNLQAVGQALMGDYVFPFELIALILFTALVGAVLIARKDPE
jgi:NADH-quinone oxidoreductase subunit J